MFENLLKADRLPSPLLLEYEKEDSSTLIQSIALKLLCETESACQSCKSCKKVLHGFHPDWIAIEGSIKMEGLRESLRSLRQKPYESKIRLFTISQFDLANAFVQNALLKVFEEPERHWYLVGVLRSRRRLLSTLRSRCLFLSLRDETNEEDLEANEKAVFHSVEKADEVKIQNDLEPFFKDRHKNRSLYIKLLREASRRFYPGHWKNLAPELEQFALAELERNLHPKIIWEKAWARSQLATAE